MPRLSRLLDAKRAPLDQALVNAMMAQADLNGMLTALRMGRDGYTVNNRETRDRIAKIVNRAHDARHALDEAGYGTLDVHTVGSRSLCTNDASDLLDAALTRLERNHYGEDEAPTNAPDPDYANDITRAESGLIRSARERGASVLHDTAEPSAAEIGRAA